jgi:hypothetical protein
MPSTTAKQARTMAAAAHNPAFAKRMGIPQSVATEFNQADAKTGILRRKRKKATGGNPTNVTPLGVSTGSNGGIGGR